MRQWKYEAPFELESGAILSGLEIGYTTYGTLNDARDNVIWVCHALTANSAVSEWWPDMVGSGCTIDTDRYYVICANVLGGCYGTTGPLSSPPEVGQPYYHDFPQLTIRDMAAAHELLRLELDIRRIELLIGGSLGGQQAMEWAITRPELFDRLVLLATNARHSPWGIAFNESQRMAIRADSTWQDSSEVAGLVGLRAARAMALLSYRNYATYDSSQGEGKGRATDHFRASSYQRYQGSKLASRFNAFSYYLLSKAMDSHDVGRNRDSVEHALATIKARTLVIGIESDLLFPIGEQRLLADHIEGAELVAIDSGFGHDGFLIETDLIGEAIEEWLAESPIYAT